MCQSPLSYQLTDFPVGEWRVHHRVLNASKKWSEFDGAASNGPLMEGWATLKSTRSTGRQVFPAASRCAHTTRRAGSGQSGGAIVVFLTVHWILRSKDVLKTVSVLSIPIMFRMENNPRALRGVADNGEVRSLGTQPDSLVQKALQRSRHKKTGSMRNLADRYSA